ncbi:hypothetical protein D3C72_895210 [compost metagenome]
MPLLIQQIGIHHLPHHRPCHSPAGFTVLDHHRHHHTRVISRGKADEQGIVAVPLQGLVAVVAFALLDRHHLRGAALAGNPVLRTGRGCAGDAARVVHDHLHALADLVPGVPVVQHDIGHRVGVHRRIATHGHGQVRAVPHALARQQAGGLGQLQRGDLHVALADAQDQRLAREPGLAPGGALPLGRRHQPGRLLEHVQRHLLAQAELGHVVVQAVDAQLVRQVVEVGVVGTHDGGVHIHPAIAAAVPVAVLVVVVGQLVVAGVEHPAARGDHAAVEAGDGHLRLHRRTGGIQAAQHAVEQRAVDGIAQGGVLFEADALDEQVGVEAGVADHRQHVAIGRVEHHHRAAAVAQGLFRGQLQVGVQGQDDVLARGRGLVVEHTHHPALGVGLDLLVAHMTVQLAFVEVLDAGLADRLGAPVFGAVEGLGLFLVDAPHIAHRVGEMLGQRVLADELWFHLQAWQAELVHRHQGDLLFAQADHQGHRLERLAATAQVLVELLAVVVGQAQHLGQGIEHLGRVAAGPLAGHGQVEAGLVVGQHHAVAVVDQPALGGDGQHVHTVVFRYGGLLVVLQHLQHIEPAHQDGDQAEDQGGAGQKPAVDQVLFLFVVLEGYGLRHRGSVC